MPKELRILYNYTSFLHSPDSDIPVMEDNHTLKQLLDTLFAQKDLKSWTVHDNKSATYVTLRFFSKIPATREIQDTVPNVTTYTRKSNYQVSRDRQRLENHHNKRNTRSQTNEDTEHVELKRGEHDYAVESSSGLSPVMSLGSQMDRSCESTSSNEPME